MTDHKPITVEVLDENFELSLDDLCQACAVCAELIIAMVEEGMIEPCGASPSDWRFTGPTLRRVEITLRLQRDLHLNLPGAALAVDLLDEIEYLRERLRILDKDLLP